MHIRECIDCYTRPWKMVEFSQRHYSSSCSMRDQRMNKGALSPSIGQQEFEIDREYYSLDETLTYKVRFHHTMSYHTILDDQISNFLL